MVYESHEWLYFIYQEIEEELPSDLPITIGKLVQTSSFFDANL